MKAILLLFIANLAICAAERVEHLTPEQPVAEQGKPDEALTAKPDGIEGAAPAQRQPAKAIEALEDLLLSPLHLRYTQTELKDQTDIHDELVFEREWLPLQDNFEVPCNVFHIEDTLTRPARAHGGISAPPIPSSGNRIPSVSRTA